MKVKLLSILTVVVVAAILMSYSVLTVGSNNNPVVVLREQLGLDENIGGESGGVEGYVYVYCNGVLWDEGPNVVTNIGLNRTRLMVHEGNYSDIVFIHISDNGTAPAAGWTTDTIELTGNGLTRAAGTDGLGNSGTGAIWINHTFTYTGGSQTVQASGLHWDGVSQSNNNLFAQRTFTQRTLATNDQITIAWQITYS